MSLPDGAARAEAYPGRAALIAGALSGVLTFISLTISYLMPEPLLAGVTAITVVAALAVLGFGRVGSRRAAAAGAVLALLPWAFVYFMLSRSDG